MNAITEKPVAIDASSRSTEKPRRGVLRSPVLRLLLLLALLIMGAVAANWWFTEGKFIESTDNAYIQGNIAVLGPRVEGDIATIPVADNQPVKAGDPLVVLDATDWQAKLDQAKGAAGEAEAAIGTARMQIAQSQTALAQADALIAEAQVEQTRAVAQAGRAGALVGAGWTSRQANDQAVADAGKANAMLAAARAQKANAERAEAVAEAQAKQAEAHKNTAEASVRLAESSLADTVIRAPFDGIVGNRAAQLGQHVQIGQQLIAIAPPARDLFIVANFKETQLRHMRPGQPVDLTADIDSGKLIHGRVDSIAPATGALFSLLPPENATGNFTKVVQRVPAKIVLDPGEAAQAGWLRAGLSVSAGVDTRAEPSQRLGFFGAAAATLQHLTPKHSG